MIYLPPNDTLIEGTLKENIVFFNDVSDSTLYQTLRYCDLESLVSRLSHGIDTNIGLKFKDLSSGEKRKISLARVLVRVPRVLLLDEPTMHISEDDKKNIIESLKTFQRNHGITMIIATHDKELYEIADKVITL
ncbi:MAG TPA: ATP-binding cassette domain-containing protein [Gallicola sp.]|nr:ATP-binding cassette domain-containing protein [Gallicola sp.]